MKAVSDPLGELPPHLIEGIRLFSEGHYLPAHETLEEYWVGLPAGSPQRDFYQGLIQLATGLHHWGRGNVTGARLQMAKALRRLSGYPPVFLGVPVGAVRDFLASAPDLMAAGEPLTPPDLSVSS